MVDALHEAHRVLRPGGIVADLRPERDPGNRRRRCIRVECHWDTQRTPVGDMYETSEYFSEYAGADRAVAHVIRDGLFWLERSETFWLHTHFRDPAVLERYLDVEWTGTTLPSQPRQALLTLVRQHPRGRIVAEDAFRLNILRKM